MRWNSFSYYKKALQSTESKKKAKNKKNKLGKFNVAVTTSSVVQLAKYSKAWQPYKIIILNNI